MDKKNLSQRHLLSPVLASMLGRVLLCLLVVVAAFAVSLQQPVGSIRGLVRRPSEVQQAVSSTSSSSLARDFVDVLRGVSPASKYLSRGNVLPLIAMPRGMTHWSVTSSLDLSDRWFFDPVSTAFRGIRCTHQPSPWIGDYGQFAIFPSVQGLGEPVYDVMHAETTYKPFYFATNLLNACMADECTRVEFVPTPHGGMMKLRFPSGLPEGKRRVTFVLQDRDWESLEFDTKREVLHGISRAAKGGILNETAFKHHFAVHVVASHQPVFSAPDFEWRTTEAVNVVLKIGTSLISASQAEKVIAVEMKGEFDELVAKAENAWNDRLRRVEITGAASYDVLRTFYTCLYRGLLFPRNLAEIDENENEVHFSPFLPDGSMKSGPLMVDSGFWDAYRTLYPMLHLIFPDIAHEVFKGWLNVIRESQGRAVQWPSPGPRKSMVGTMSDASLSEAFVNGVFNTSEEDEVYASLLKNAFDGNGPNSRGSELGEYVEKGYISKKTALTLNFKLSDFAISCAAEARGDLKTMETLRKRSLDWKSLWDPQTRFLRSPNGNGRHSPEFDEFHWDLEDYTEGGPWQYRFYVPHDIKGLEALYHSDNSTSISVCDTLEEMMMMKQSAFHMHSVFHEATELPTNCFGQYGHNNQPSHHIMYIFAQAGCAQKGFTWIYKVIDELYGPLGFAGDEDNGEMSSWYILSSLGLYMLKPGSGKYQIGAPPRFSSVKISRPEGYGGDLIISSSGLRSKSISFDGNAVQHIASDVVEISYRELLKGGILKFQN